VRSAADAADAAGTAATQALSWVNTLLAPTMKIVVIVVAALIARFLMNRLWHRIAEGIASGRPGTGRLEERLPTATAILMSSPLLSARREQRARTTASVLKSATTVTVAVVSLLTIMQVLDIPVAPLLASAGVIGVALGLGAQALVKDVIAGLFMIADDQYGVGDMVDLGAATGTVEAVGLRVTRLRDADGTVWYLRNGEVLRVGNRSQGWARAVLDVALPPGQDVTRAQDLLLDVAKGLQKDDTFAADVLEDPQVWGVEAVTKDGLVVRLVVKTRSLRQWAVARELRHRIVDRFAEEGLDPPVGLQGPADPGIASV
jgi:moderate conductance mechanosensitive channel